MGRQWGVGIRKMKLALITICMVFLACYVQANDVSEELLENATEEGIVRLSESNPVAKVEEGEDAEKIKLNFGKRKISFGKKKKKKPTPAVAELPEVEAGEDAEKIKLKFGKRKISFGKKKKPTPAVAELPQENEEDEDYAAMELDAGSIEDVESQKLCLPIVGCVG